jgi:cytochrome c oxidase cbb3-type subunit 3/ubiquinol-cytochrome c reductase cytochrome c subunit
MPGYENQVSPQTIDDLVVLIRSWARPVDAPEPEPFEVDLTKAVINEGGPNASFQLRDGRFASASDVNSAMDSGEAFILIDARPTADYLASHIAGAISIPFYAVDSFIDLLPRDRFIITYCGCPHAVSGQAADALLEAGFQDVAILDEGFYFWEEQGWPIEIGPPAN